MDLLMLSFAFTQQQQFNQSAQLISFILSKNLSTDFYLKDLKPFEKTILLSLIERLKEKVIFSNNTQEIINQLKQNIEPKIINELLPLKSIFPDAGCKLLFPE